MAAGFAFTENILYFGRAFGEEADMGGSVLFTLILRGVLSPFAHPLFTSMTGIGAGIAANSRNAAARPFYVLGGYALAVVLHALWNSSASLFDGGAFLIVYGFVMVPLFAAMVTIVIWQRRREQAVIAEQLPGFAQAGWIAPSEIQLLSSLAGRRGWRRGRAAAVRAGGREGRRPLPGGRHRPGVPARPHARGAIGPMARQWHDERCRRGDPGAAAGRRAPGGADGGLAAAAPPGWTPPPPPPPGWPPDPSPPPGRAAPARRWRGEPRCAGRRNLGPAARLTPRLPWAPPA